MAVMNIYDLNARANAIYKEFIKEQDSADRSNILYGEMQVFAENNINMLRYLRR